MSKTIEKNCLRLYGCAYAEAMAINGSDLRAAGSLASAYDKQRSTAKSRGIAWELTFPTWFGIWQDSGRLHQRGRGASSYCMARHGDAGPYAVGNVSIQTVATNSRAALQKMLIGVDLNASRRRRRGTGRGWTFVAKQTLRPYQVQVGSTYVGSFATKQEAEAAYAVAAA